MAIKLVVDSACDISQDEAEKLGIIRIPMQVSFNEKVYSDGVDLSPEEFYEKLIESDTLPTTSQISPYAFEEIFKRIIENGDTPVAVTLSSKLSGTYQSALIAAESFNGRAFAVDSLNVSLGEAILIKYACRRIKDGIGAAELIDELNEKKGQIEVLALLDTLEYLKKGGRISAAVAFAGGVLAIKPVVGVSDGEIRMVGKARGSKQANNLLANLIEKCGGIDFSMPLYLAYTGLNDQLLNKYVEDSKYLWLGQTEDLPVLKIGATIGTHVGPGAIGVAFFKKA